MTTIRFSYVPQTGPLSGPSFVSQTERVFNELGDEINAAQDAADEALRVARSAQTTTLDAQQTAQDALFEAQKAKREVENAAEAALAARQGANHALATANTALNNAATADSKAILAQQQAAEAHDAARTAQASADEGMEKALAAINTAESAFGLARSAKGNFRIVHEADDADEYIDPDKVFFNDTVPVAHLPASYADKGGYLKIYTAEGEAGDGCILQTFYSTDGAAVFRREGQRTVVEEEDQEIIEIVTWREWIGLLDNAVIMDVDGKISEDVLPSGVVRAINGKIDPSLLPDAAPSTTTAYQVSSIAPEDTTRLWVRPSDSTLYYHNGTAWTPIVGVYAETTTP